MSGTGLQVGQAAEFSKTVTENDVERFAGITGDFNPVHVDETQAAKLRFGGRIAHGMHTAGLISACISMRLLGPGTIYLRQSLKFTRPVRIGDTVTARVEILEWDATKRHARLATTCRNQRNDVVIDGEALVLVPDEGSRASP